MKNGDTRFSFWASIAFLLIALAVAPLIAPTRSCGQDPPNFPPADKLLVMRNQSCNIELQGGEGKVWGWKVAVSATYRQKGEWIEWKHYLSFREIREPGNLDSFFKAKRLARGDCFNWYEKLDELTEQAMKQRVKEMQEAKVAKH